MFLIIASLIVVGCVVAELTYRRELRRRAKEQAHRDVLRRLELDAMSRWPSDPAA